MSRFIDLKGILERARKGGAKDVVIRINNLNAKRKYEFKFNLYENGITISVDNLYAGFIGYLHEEYTVKKFGVGFHKQFGLFGKLKVDVLHDYKCSENGSLQPKRYGFEVNADGLLYFEAFRKEIDKWAEYHS